MYLFVVLALHLSVKVKVNFTAVVPFPRRHSLPRLSARAHHHPTRKSFLHLRPPRRRHQWHSQNGTSVPGDIPVLLGSGICCRTGDSWNSRRKSKQ